MQSKSFIIVQEKVFDCAINTFFVNNEGNMIIGSDSGELGVLELNV